MVRLRRLAISGFRPFREQVRLDDLRSLNLISGPNNAGKSAILLALRRLAPLDPAYVAREAPIGGVAVFGDHHFASVRSDDFNRGARTLAIDFELQFPHLQIDTSQIRYINFDVEKTNIIADYATKVANGVVPISVTATPPTVDWASPRLDFHLPEEWALSALEWAGSNSPQLLQKQIRAKTRPEDWTKLVKAYQAAGTRFALHLSQSLVYVPQLRPTSERLEYPDERAQGERLYDGRSLLSDVVSWSLPNPITGESLNTNNHQQFTAAAETVLETSVEVWPGSNLKSLRVKLGGSEARDLRDLGAGIAQVLVLAACLTNHPKSILLLEEPEIGLHPSLQRNLIRLLLDSKCQSFITTHSAHLLDVQDDQVQVFCVAEAPHQTDTPSHKSTTRTVVKLGPNRRTALSSLGVRPSSVTAANAVIWVEGPSDALLLRHWIHRIRPSIREGLDFTFAFSGGALLSHASVERSYQPLALLDVHPTLFLIADSDRRRADAEPKHEYLQCLLASPTLRERCWVTQPKEIEGYLSDGVLKSSIGTSPTMPEHTETTSVYCSLQTRLKNLGLAQSWANRKTSLARRAISTMEVLPNEIVFAPHDLGKQLAKLIAFIDAAQRRIPA